tara:strand:- start:122 stop:598 length:477 start_codon:yes stop_codon:yes gene_type:complete
VLIEKIVSGGQTGADRAALDWAIAGNVPHGGWCPQGRRAEDGSIAGQYLLNETPERGYRVRTEWNIRDSDATVIFSIAGRLTGGSLLTRRIAARWNRPCLHLSRDKARDPFVEFLAFIEESRAKIINVAGPRASHEPDVGGFVKEVLDMTLGSMTERG